MVFLSAEQKFRIAFVFVLVLSLLLVLLLSGVQHETRKFKALLVTLFLVLLFGHTLGDACYFVLRALCLTYRRGSNSAARSEPPLAYSRHDFLRLRLVSLRSSLLLTERHRNEAANLTYKETASELWLFLRYFVLLLLLVVYSRDPLAYYNTHIVHTTLQEPIISQRGTLEVHNVGDLYDYIEHTLIESFNEADDYDSRRIKEPGWIRFEIAKLLGVVRLRQVRYRCDAEVGQLRPHFSRQSYLPGWLLPYKEYHYLEKYLRIYGPWIPYVDTSFTSALLMGTHYGDLHTYAEDEGYATLLARDYNNSMKILAFLQEQVWLDKRTAALFVDFTLFNVDSNLFSVCSLLLEQTPFGDILSHVDVQSCELLMNLNHLSYLGLFILMLYTLQLIQFVQVFVLKVWHTPKAALRGWNVLDALIVFLNLLILFLFYRREATVTELIQHVEESHKLQFLDFRIPAQLDYLAVVFIGLLVCVATVRIWKILQFASVFRMFTRTLHIAKWALFSTTLIIAIFLFSFGLSSCLINGANSYSFTRVIKSLTAAMSFSFGLGTELKPKDLNYGGYTLGFLLYAILMLVVAIILINLFITLIIDHFAAAKEQEIEERGKFKLNFLQFLAVEYASCWKWLRSNCCKREEAAVFTQMQKALDKHETEHELRKQQQAEQKFLHEESGIQEDEQTKLAAVLEEHRERLDRLDLSARILQIQMELLERDLTLFAIERESDDEEPSPRKTPKNGQIKAERLKGKNMSLEFEDLLRMFAKISGSNYAATICIYGHLFL